MRSITGATRVVAVIGDPARYSLSPTMHNAAFAACDLDWVYVAHEVARGNAAQALEAMRTLGIVGYSVTMPHKADVADAVDACTPEAAALRAVNCVTNDHGVLRGDNTDGVGFLRGLRDDSGFDVTRARCVVLGAGGAARAVIAALAAAGATEVYVVNRSADAAARAAVLGGVGGRVGDIDSVAEADLIVNATPLGMSGPSVDEMPCDPTLVRRGAVAVDLVYEPRETAWLAALRAREVHAANGLSMLVHQAARQFEIWTGAEPPVAVMKAAARDALASRFAGNH